MNLVIETLGDPESQSHFLSTYLARMAMSAADNGTKCRRRQLCLLVPSKAPDGTENIIVGLEKMSFHVKQIAFERECPSNGAAIFGLK